MMDRIDENVTRTQTLRNLMRRAEELFAEKSFEGAIALSEWRNYNRCKHGSLLDRFNKVLKTARAAGVCLDEEHLAKQLEILTVGSTKPFANGSVNYAKKERTLRKHTRKA